MKPAPSYGGQAVIEGVMMRGPDTWAVACRCPDNSISVEKRPVESVTLRFPFLKWPFIRGSVVLIESMAIGVRALNYSAGRATGGEDEPVPPREVTGTIILALSLAVVLFIVAPALPAHLMKPLVSGGLGQNLLEGAIRVSVFLAYVAGIGLIKDIQRVFRYHGAEHKVINAFEAGVELTPANVRPYPVVHPRCGTGFLLLVIMLTVFVFVPLPLEPLWWRIASRILVLPLVVGMAYEFVKFAARRPKSLWGGVLTAPGLALQRLTTREPTDDQVEVAIAALNAVRLDEGKEGDPNAGQTRGFGRKI